MPSGEVRHGRRSRHPQAHPRLSVRPRRARAGALPRQRLHAVRPPLRRTLGTSAADRREGRGRGALALAPRWLAASGRFRGGRHAARPRPPEPHHQSILPGPTADLQLNTLSYRCISATPAPVNFSLESQSDEAANAFSRTISDDQSKSGSKEDYGYDLDASFHGDASMTSLSGGEANAHLSVRGGSQDTRSAFATA